MDFDKLNYTDRKIIVGIDFGTTYSGVAWAETKRPDRRVAITAWPISNTAREGESSDKVPTKLRYTSEGVQWGFQIPSTAPPEEVIEWFKLYATFRSGPLSSKVPDANCSSVGTSIPPCKHLGARCRRRLRSRASASTSS